uniref:Uncharacterized protein n=1 Tax=Chromera velia CCMP2878 TaxID=1169474 RepID=A0A0G4HBT2_9ALVE|eukprot:Cvel_25905.t1-p1 / transcript=Cvel_25905.t1 / gene=Cvel_25905 / organism=Chromera_velia_CCMP2878 / gene_product=hypothetical protein / transcript_product=hypothetical protein / location=Cvel_scaffold2993:12451-13587(+) / protein_length=379 / sequence_SO=supercontig / SO=protein_coding / is_pseudo=false
MANGGQAAPVLVPRHERGVLAVYPPVRLPKFRKRAIEREAGTGKEDGGTRRIETGDAVLVAKAVEGLQRGPAFGRDDRTLCIGRSERRTAGGKKGVETEKRRKRDVVLRLGAAGRVEGPVAPLAIRGRATRKGGTLGEMIEGEVVHHLHVDLIPPEIAEATVVLPKRENRRLVGDVTAGIEAAVVEAPEMAEIAVETVKEVRVGLEQTEEGREKVPVGQTEGAEVGVRVTEPARGLQGGIPVGGAGEAPSIPLMTAKEIEIAAGPDLQEKVVLEKHVKTSGVMMKALVVRQTVERGVEVPLNPPERTTGVIEGGPDGHIETGETKMIPLTVQATIPAVLVETTAEMSDGEIEMTTEATEKSIEEHIQGRHTETPRMMAG